MAENICIETNLQSFTNNKELLKNKQTRYTNYKSQILLAWRIHGPMNQYHLLIPAICILSFPEIV